MPSSARFIAFEIGAVVVDDEHLLFFAFRRQGSEMFYPMFYDVAIRVVTGTDGAFVVWMIRRIVKQVD